MKKQTNLKTLQADKPVTSQTQTANPANKRKLTNLLKYKHEIDWILYCEQERILRILAEEIGDDLIGRNTMNYLNYKIKTKHNATESILTNDK